MLTIEMEKYTMNRTKKSERKLFSIVFTVALICLMTAAIIPGVMGAELDVTLGAAGNFAILTKTGITDLTPPSDITGAVGSTIDGSEGILVSCTEVAGTIYGIDAGYTGGSDGNTVCYAANDVTTAPAAVYDMMTAYTEAGGRTVAPVRDYESGLIGGKTLAPGLYWWGTDVNINTGTLTLDAGGNGNAVWILQSTGSLKMATNTNMVLANGANAEHIYWYTEGTPGAEILTGAHAEGTILTLKEITMGSGASLNGRALSQTAVTLLGNTVTIPQTIAAPVADFTFTPASGPVPLDVTFTDTSTPVGLIRTWAWTFGDGGTSSVKNPVHTYYTTGTYTVQLTVTNDGGTSTKSDAVNVIIIPPVASFTSNVTSGTAPVAVTFTDTSTNTPTEWNWNATNVTGNNTPFTFSIERNPTQVFAVGNYSIVLNARNSAGSALSTQVTFINVTAETIAPVANFTGSRTSGRAPVAVTFTSTSSNTPTAWNWSFTNVTGDNTPVWFSTLQTPVYIFGVGNYSIVLNASNSAGYNLSTQVKFINVTAGGVPDVNGSVYLGTADNFAILAKTGVSDATPASSSITGDVGVHPASGTYITGVSCTEVSGKIYDNDAGYTGGWDSNTSCKETDPTLLDIAVGDMETAYTDAATRTGATELAAESIGGLTFGPGLYHTDASVTIPTDVTLSGGADDVWIFQIAQKLDISSATKVNLSGGAQAKNIFWQVAGTTTLGTTSVFEGTILGSPTASYPIALQTGATLHGRALAQSAVTLEANTVTIPTTVTATATSKTGVYRPGVGFFLKMDNPSANTAWNSSTDKSLIWDNAAGDHPIVGDWNKDGTKETGVYRSGEGFYLKMDAPSANTAWNSLTDKSLIWDNAVGDLPIAGDWNKDGYTETGVYRPGVGFYLKMDNSSANTAWNSATDLALVWDNAVGDLPIAGDWNKDGYTETGVYRPRVGFFLKMDNSSANTAWNSATDLALVWDNAAGDLPVVGDWNKDGYSETGVYRPNDGFYLKMDAPSDNTQWDSVNDLHLIWDNANGDLPLAGNFV
jgi:PKD repeat protein